MQVFDFLVQGSAATPYEVRFTITDAGAKAACTCAAGLAGQICKHRLRLLAGITGDCPGASKESLAQLSDAIAGTALGGALERLRRAEQLLQDAKTAEAAARRALGRIMAG